MPVGWRRVVRVVRERGQSEVLGATLLTGIMVILVAMAGLFLFADFGGDEEQLLANIEGDVAAEGITLTHDGGDSFDSADIAVVLTGDNDRDLSLSSNFTASQGGNDQLAPGDVWRYNSSDDLILGSGRMLVIDESTNTVLFDEGYRVEVAPGGVQLRVTDWNGDSQSDEADIYGEGDSSNDDDGKRWDYEVLVDFDDDEDPVKNPDEINISLDSSESLEHNLTDHDLVAYNPSNNSESVTVTANVDGFPQSDEVTVNVYEVAKLSVSIDSVNSSQSASSTRSGGAFGARSRDSSTQVPKGGSIDVTFTVSNNESAPALNETVLFTSDALESDESRQYSRVEPGEDRTETISLDLNDSLGLGSQTVEVEINDTVQETIDLTVVDNVSQLAQFDVTVKEEESFLGTFYGSESSLSVAAEVENTGDENDTQNITLDVDGTESTTSVTLAGGASKTVTLSLDNLDNGSYTANVSSENDSATTNARVFGTTPDLLAGVETVSGTVGETVQVGVEVVSFDSGSNDVASYFLGFSYDNSTITLDTVDSNKWKPGSSNIRSGSGEVLVNGFTGEKTPAEPAIIFNVTLDNSGETTIEFDDDALPGGTTNTIAETIREEYDVHFVDGKVIVKSSS